MKVLFFASVLLLTIGFSSCNEEKKPADTDAKPGEFFPDTSRANIQNRPNVYPGVDVSPMDMSYFPVDYPKIKMTNSNIPPPVMRVIYSRPHLQKRHLFKELLKYDEPWRLGANESSEIEFFKPVKIEGKSIAAGRYIIYCIPHINSWTIVLNSNIDTWGLQQDESKDVQRFTAPEETVDQSQEYFTMEFENAEKGANLVISWDNFVVRLPIQF